MFPPSAPIQGEQVGCPATQAAQEALKTGRADSREQFFEPSSFVRLRKALVAHGLDKPLFDMITSQLKPGRSGSRPALSSMPPSSPPPVRTLARHVGSSTKASQRFMASRLMSAPMPTPPWSKRSRSRPPTSTTARQVPMPCRTPRRGLRCGFRLKRAGYSEAKPAGRSDLKPACNSEMKPIL